jgi:hypothetical protein
MMSNRAIGEEASERRSGRAPWLAVAPEPPEPRRRALVPVAGPLDRDRAGRFLERVRPLCRYCCWVVLDLGQVDRLDDEGARALLLLREEMLAEQAEIRLVVPAGSHVDADLAFFHLVSRFRVFRTVLDAWLGDAPAASAG